MQQVIDHTLFESGAQAELDKSLLVKFEYRQRPDDAESLKQGRPMFKDVLYIDIKVAGSRTGGACRPARANDLKRFPAHYEAFLKRTEAPTSGTPLAEWALMSRSLVEELAYHNVKTVEQLVEMADVHVSKFQGLNGLKNKAKEWLKQADKVAQINKIDSLEERLAQVIDRNEQLESQLQELMAEKNAKVNNLDNTPEPKVEAEPVATKPKRARRLKGSATKNKG